ncbi:AAA family ATPase [Paracoccus endophyticus]|uniref:AAA family ATPase n=1 Tax=Paracoccus endophyticus TaxID=2233774 RepID=UPI000DD7D704|nr:AAA family ATPase [Paracoccus endophyticus]
MALFPIMHAKWPELSGREIEARLTRFLLDLRRRREPDAWQDRVAEPGEDGSPDDVPVTSDGGTSWTFLTFAEKTRIAQRADRLHKRQLAASGLHHLDREDQARLKVLGRGVRLARIPNEHRADELAAELHAEMPWMAPATEYAWNAMRRSVRDGEAGFRLPPVILDGPPGIGKTRWARRLGQLIGAESTVVDATAEAASFAIVGCQRGWSSARPGRLLDLVVAKLSGNPIMVIDELDKAGHARSDKGVSFGLAEGLLPLLERSTAATWTCPYYRVALDMSFVSWVMLTNSLKPLPEPLLSRCTVIRLSEVSLADLVTFADHEGRSRGLSEASVEAIVDALQAASPMVRSRPSLRTVLRMLERASDLETKPKAM